MIQYDNQLSSEDYIKLRKAVGFATITKEQAERGIQNSTFIVTAKDQGVTVGMARILFDYGYTVYVSDVIVLPQYQGMKIGKSMMEAIFQFVEEHSTQGEYICYNLCAARKKQGFYEKLGFVTLPSGNFGPGMQKRIYLEENS